jgi:hypothetical protein
MDAAKLFINRIAVPSRSSRRRYPTRLGLGNATAREWLIAAGKRQFDESNSARFWNPRNSKLERAEQEPAFTKLVYLEGSL